MGRFVFSVASSLPGKKMPFKAKNGAIRDQLEPIRLQGPPVISKWV